VPIIQPGDMDGASQTYAVYLNQDDSAMLEQSHGQMVSNLENACTYACYLTGATSFGVADYWKLYCSIDC